MENITGQRIRELRTEKGMTQQELAEMFDKTGSAPRMWELGKSMPDASTLKKLAAYFNCSSDYLLGISDFRTERDKIEFFHTEKVFFEELSRLRERDKMRLIHCLNHFIYLYKDVEEKTGLDFELFSSLVKSIALMLEEIKFEMIRSEEKICTQTDSVPKKTFEVSANGIICLGMLKLKADESLDSIYRQLLTFYLKLLNEGKGICKF